VEPAVTVQTDYAELFKLPVSERLKLVQDLWDSIADDVESGREDLPLPQWQIEELERRQAKFDAGEMELIPWEEVKRRMQDQR